MGYSEIPHIRNSMWQLTQYSLENLKRNFNVLNEKKGKDFLKEILSEKKIAQFRWEVQSKQKSNLLEIYCRNFLQTIEIYYRQNIQKLEGERLIQFKKSTELKEYFNSQFKKLEEEVLLNSEFVYKIYIPAWRISFPENINIIHFDSEHKIRDIRNDKEPYRIKKFKKPPRFWNPFEQQQTLSREADTSFEVIYKIGKRKVTDPPYDDNTDPINISTLYGNNEIFEKMRSLYEFFFCYFPIEDFPPFTFGYQYFVDPPPFSIPPYPPPYHVTKGSTGYLFHYPKGFLDLRDPDRLKKWKQCWKDNYQFFYKNFYNLNDPEKVRIFHYTINVLRTIFNIPFWDMKVFLLVSTFEGLLFKKKIRKKINKNLNANLPQSKRIRSGTNKFSVIKTFIKICRDYNKRWAFQNSNSVPELKYIIDLEKFILSAFDYRNYIAHPAKKNKIKFRPKNLYSLSSSVSSKESLAYLINDWFKKFLKFVISIWINRKITDKEEWYQYLDSLFL